MEAEKGCLGRDLDVYVVVQSGTKFFGSFFSQEKCLKPPCLKYLNFY